MTVTKPGAAPLPTDPLQPTASSSRRTARAGRAGEPQTGRRFAATLAAATAPRSTAREPVPDRLVAGPSKAQDAVVRDDQGQQTQPDPAGATAAEATAAAATSAVASAVTVALAVIAPAPAPTAAAAGPEVPKTQNFAIGPAEPAATLAATLAATSRAAATAATPPSASPSTSPNPSTGPSPSPGAGPSASPGPSPAPDATAVDAPSSAVAVLTAGGTVAGPRAEDVDPAPTGTTGPAASHRTDLADGQVPPGPAEQSASGNGSGASTGQPGGQGTAAWAMAATAGPAGGTATSTATRTDSTVPTALTGVGPQRGRAAITDSDPGPTVAAAQPEQPVEPTTPFGAIGPTGSPTGASTATPSAQAAASTASADPAAPSAPAPPVVDQVTRHLLAARLLRDGTHHTVMHLSPEHLGPVTVTVDVRDGAVRLELVGGSGALGALGHDLDSLRSQLADAGLDLADVAMRSDDQAGNPFGRGPGERRPDGGPDGGRAGAPGAGSADQPIEQPSPIADVTDQNTDQNTDQLTPNPADHRGRLDVRV